MASAATAKAAPEIEFDRDAADIRAGIERARQEIELSVTDLRNEVARTFDARRLIREHPAAILGGAFALGFLIAVPWGE